MKGASNTYFPPPVSNNSRNYEVGHLRNSCFNHSLDAKRNKPNQKTTSAMTVSQYSLKRVVGLFFGGFVWLLFCCVGCFFFFLNSCTYPAQKGASWTGMKDFFPFIWRDRVKVIMNKQHEPMHFSVWI